MKRRVLNVLIAFDQLAYVLLTFGGGMPDETLSSAAYRTEKAGKIGGRIFRPIIDALFWPIEKHHCRNAYLAEVRRKHFPDLQFTP